MNSTCKAPTVAVTTTTPTTVSDSTKHSATRPHQILSRETSFVSKPTINVVEEKKDESQMSINSTAAIATVQVQPQPVQIAVPSAITTTVASVSTITITSK